MFSTNNHNGRWLHNGTVLMLLFSFAGLVAASASLNPDIGCWREWTLHTQRQGLRQAYFHPDNDYPPLYQYMLWLCGKISRLPEQVEETVRYLRLLTLAFDVAGIWFVAKWIGRKEDWIPLVILSTLNIGFSFNTLFWGQVDGIQATLYFSALYLAWRNKMVASGVLMALALAFKLQSVVMVPVWGILMLDGARAQRRWAALPLTALAMAAVIGLAAAPFLFTAHSRTGLYASVFGAVDRYPVISLKATNLWYWLLEGDLRWTPDNVRGAMGLTYKQIGLTLFFATSAVAMWPMAQRLFANFRNPSGAAPFPRRVVWLTAALATLLFYFFNTQMHERYAHPALLPLLAYAYYARDFFPYAIFCVAYFLGLENTLQWLKLENYDTLIFDGRFLAGFYALLIVYLGARLYGWKGGLRATGLPALPVKDSDRVSRAQP